MAPPSKSPPRFFFLTYLSLDLPVFFYLSLLSWQSLTAAPSFTTGVPAVWLTATSLLVVALVVNLSNTKKTLNYSTIAFIYIFGLKAVAFWFLNSCGFTWRHSYLFECLFQVLSAVRLKLPSNRLLAGAASSAVSFAALRAFDAGLRPASLAFWASTACYSLLLFATCYGMAGTLMYAIQREDFGIRPLPYRRDKAPMPLPAYKRWTITLTQTVQETAATVEPLLLIAAVCLPLIIYPVMHLVHKSALSAADSTLVFQLLTALGCAFIMGAVERSSLSVVLFKQLTAALAVLDDLLPGHVAARMLEKASGRSYTYGLQYAECLQLLSQTIEQLRLQRMLGIRAPPARRRSYHGAGVARRRASTSAATSMGSRRSSVASEGSDGSTTELLCEEELLLLDLLASGRLQQWLRTPAQSPWLADVTGTDSPRRVDSPRRRYSVRMREALGGREGQPSMAVQRLIDSERSASRRSSAKSTYSEIEMDPIEEVRESSGKDTPEVSADYLGLHTSSSMLVAATRLPSDALEMQEEQDAGRATVPDSLSGSWVNTGNTMMGAPRRARSEAAGQSLLAAPAQRRRRRSSTGAHSELLQRMGSDRATSLANVDEAADPTVPTDELVPTPGFTFLQPAGPVLPRARSSPALCAPDTEAVTDTLATSFSSEFSMPGDLQAAGIGSAGMHVAGKAGSPVGQAGSDSTAAARDQASALCPSPEISYSQSRHLSEMTGGDMASSGQNSVTSNLTRDQQQYLTPLSTASQNVVAPSSQPESPTASRGGEGRRHSTGVKVGRSSERRGRSKGRRLSYAEWHDQVTILFADIVGFTSMSTQAAPHHVMHMLNELYTKFDNLCMEMGVYKVETVGDCYMAATNLVTRDPDHVATMVKFALRMQQAAAQVASPAGVPLQLRIGMHSGRVMSGVVGRIRRRYCLFGDTVNTASRMESSGSPGQVQVSPDVYQILKGHSEFKWQSPREVQIKGKGTMTTYTLDLRRTQV